MIVVAVETYFPAGSEPPAAVCVRISMGERHGFGAAASLSTRASSFEQGRVGGLVESLPKLARQIGLGSASAEEPSTLITCSAAATPFVRLRVLMSLVSSDYMVRRS